MVFRRISSCRLRLVSLLLPGLLLLTSCHAASASGSSAGAAPRRSGQRLLPPSAASAEDRKFDAFFLEAIRQKEKGAEDAAFELLNHALRLRPNAPEALYELAMLYRRVFPQQTAEACRLLERAARIDTANVFYMDELAGLYLRMDSMTAAARIYESMASRSGQSLRALVTLLSIYGQAQDYPKVIGVLDRLERHEGKSDAISRERYKTYLLMKDEVRALAELEALQREYPGDMRYRLLAADLYMQTERPDSAYAVYREVIAREPDNGYARLGLMNYYAATGNEALYQAEVDSIALNERIESPLRAEAVKSLVRSTERAGGDSLRVMRLFGQLMSVAQPDFLLADLCQGYMLLKQVPADRIVPVWQKMLSIEPEYDGARLQLLEYYIRNEKLAETAALCAEGTQYAPEQLAYYFYGGAAYNQLGQTDRAIALLERGRVQVEQQAGEGGFEAEERKLPSDLMALLGDVYHEVGRLADAYATYEKALGILPENVLCLNNYAYFLSLDGHQLDKAEAMSLKTIEAEPGNPTYLDTYAWILFVQGKYKMAQTYMDETLKNLKEEPENAGIYEHAGDIYACVGRTAEAVAFWKKAQRLGGDSPLLQKKIKQKKYLEK